MLPSAKYFEPILARRSAIRFPAQDISQLVSYNMSNTIERVSQLDDTSLVIMSLDPCELHNYSLFRQLSSHLANLC